MYGVRFYQDAIHVQEGNKTELEANGYEVFDTKEEAATRGINLEYRTLRKEFNAMSLTDFDCKRAKELEKKYGENRNLIRIGIILLENILTKGKRLCSNCRAFLSIRIGRSYHNSILVLFIFFE